MFSWGAGECGQLGTGRCTRRELPELVSFDSGNDGNGVSRGVIDIACGSAHCLAVVHEDCDDRDSDGETRAGVIYSWGLNSCGQLGNGQSKALHYPQRIAEFRGSVHDDGEIDYSRYRFENGKC